MSNPSTGNQRISTPPHSVVIKIRKYVLSELMVQMKQTGVNGVETPPQKASWADIYVHAYIQDTYIYICISHMKMCTDEIY